MSAFAGLSNWPIEGRKELVVIVPPKPLESKKGKKKARRDLGFWHNTTLRIGKRSGKKFAAVWIGFRVDDVVRAMAATMVSQGLQPAGNESSVKNEIIDKWRIYTVDLGTERVADLRHDREMALGDGDLKKHLTDDTPGWRVMERVIEEGFPFTFTLGSHGPGGAAWRMIIDIEAMDRLYRLGEVTVKAYERFPMPRRVFPIIRRPYPPDTVEAKLMEFVDRNALKRFTVTRVAPVFGAAALLGTIASAVATFT